MKIILDTNILRQDFTLRSRKFEMFFNYVKRTGSKILMPEVVLAEIEELYRREFTGNLATYKKCIESLNKIAFCPVKAKLTGVVIKKNLELFRKNLLDKLRVTKKDIISYNKDHLPLLVTRSIKRIPPFTESRSEFRDALIWLTALDLATAEDDKKIALVSLNTKDFGASDSSLHPELKKEGEARGVTVNYYPSMDDFLKAHASKIEFITGEWILANIDFKRHEDDLVKVLESYSIWRLEQLAEQKDENFQEISQIIQVLQTNILDYYVFEMDDGTLRVEVELESELEVEYYTYQEKEEYSDSGYSRDRYDDIGLSSIWTTRTVRETKVDYFYPMATGEVHIIVRDGIAESVELVESYV